MNHENNARTNPIFRPGAVAVNDFRIMGCGVSLAVGPTASGANEAIWVWGGEEVSRERLGGGFFGANESSCPSLGRPTP